MTDLAEGFGCGDLRHDAARIRALARRVAADVHGADDLAQQFALSELSRPEHERRPRSLRWVLGALRNLRRKEHRGEGRRRRREHVAARPEPAVSPVDAVQHAETLQRVVGAALRLDEPYRTTILLRYLDDLSVDEVARRTGVPASTVRVRCMRAIEQLRGRLRRELGPEFAAALLVFADAVPSSPGAPMTGALRDPVTTGGTKMLIPLATALALGAAFLFDLAPQRPSAPPQAGSAAADRSVPPLSGDTAEARDVVTPAMPRPELSATDFPALAGKVVDQAGRPVEGATVRVFDRPFEGAEGMRSGEATPPPVVTSTAADGTWSLPKLHPFATWGVEVQAPGFAQALHMQRPDAETTVTLHPAATLRGTVRDADTMRPLPGVRVRVHGLRLSGDRAFLYREVTTGSDGGYRLEGVRADAPLHVAFAQKGTAPAFATFHLLPHRDNTEDVTLGGSAAVELTVVDAETRQPIAGAEIAVSGLGRDALPATDASGWRLVPMPRCSKEPVRSDWATRARVQAWAKGYCATSAWLPPTTGLGAKSLELRLVRSGRVTGTVVDGEGAPVAGAHVGWRAPPLRWVEPSGSASVGPDSVSAVTDDAGRFALEHVLPSDRTVEGELRVWSAAGTASVGAALPAAASVTRDFRIALGAGVRVMGRALINGTGTAAYVYVEPALGQGRKVHTRATADGTFAVFDLVPGTYRFTVVTGDGSAQRQERIVDISGDTDDLVLELNAQFAHIRGTVTTDGGAPATGSHVLAFAMPRGTKPAEPGDDERFATMLDGPDGGMGMEMVAGVAEVQPDGSFALSLLPDPELCYRVAVHQGGFGVSASAVPQGASAVHLVVPRLAPVTVELVRASGDIVERAGVHWRQAGTEREVTLAGHRPMETAGGVLGLELPLGDLVLTLRDAATGAEQTVSLHVPEHGLPERVRVEF